MKKALLFIYGCIVGQDCGFSGEGNRQWYFFLSLVMIDMLTWTFRPELAAVFTALSVLSFVIVSVFGEEMLCDEICYRDKRIPRRWAMLYFGIHLAIAIACLILNWWWTLLMAGIMLLGMALSPDCGGCNFFVRELNVPHVFSAMLCNTIWFAAFVAITCLLPVATWIKIVIIAACMILHPIIDIFEGECMSIEEAWDDASGTIAGMFEERKARKQNEAT